MLTNLDASAKVDLAGAAVRLHWRGMDILAHVRSPRVAELALLMPGDSFNLFRGIIQEVMTNQNGGLVSISAE